jgi:hypothetical protein
MMIVREAKVQLLERNLYPLYFEINVLKRRVEDANLGGGGECCQEMRDLIAQYRSVEAMVQGLRESSEIAFEERFAAVEKQINDLARYVSSQSPWIMMKVSNHYSAVY